MPKSKKHTYAEAARALDNAERIRIAEKFHVKPEDVTLPHERTVDPVNHPAHYGGADNPYEVIKVLENWFPEGVVAFCICNAIKYLARAGKKGDFMEDVKKARWYIDYVVERARSEKS